MKVLEWVNPAKTDYIAFPEAVKDDPGYQLHQLQTGNTPANAKPFKYLGKGITGVCELVQPVDGDTLRVAYVAKFENAVVVLHCWLKKSQKTSLSDKKLIARRYLVAKEEHS